MEIPKNKEFLRVHTVENSKKTVTINLRPDNFLKIKELDIFLSKIVAAFIETNDKKEIEKMFPKNLKLTENCGRIVSSITLKKEHCEKIKNVNKTLLVNYLIESL